MTRRPGVTLVEVLVAIFITGVGLLALLVLFPLGALEMAQAIKDDRVGHIKENAAAAALIWDVRNDVDVQTAMISPGGNVLPPLDPTVNANGASYPVLVDPIGWEANPSGSSWKQWVAGDPRGIPRRTIRSLFIDDPNGRTNGQYRYQQLRKWMTFLDDIDFPKDDSWKALPCPPAGLVQRAPFYSVAYLCRMPRVRAPKVVELTVIVYRGRALDLATSGESFYPQAFFGADASGNAHSNMVAVTWGAGQTAPDIRLGGWILDGTMTPNPHGYFYRVVNVNQTGANTMEIEVETPVRTTGSGQLIILDNVIEVFERGTF